MISDIDLHLGRRLRRRRRMMGMTQRQLAEAVGVRFQQIHKYECAANCLSASRLWSLAKVLNAPVAYFFDGFTENVEGPTADPLAAADEPAATRRSGT
jgi:transcriptional regulator with XRE-family HTH domain